MKANPLPPNFYQQPTLTIAQALLGKYLCRKLDDSYIIGKIVETEAYIGEDDPACHAARGKTPRNAVMYGPPGFAYIYFIYGMHHCLNVVTEPPNFPAAVLIRAVEPVEGIEQMKHFRKLDSIQQLANGPGKLCKAFNLDRTLNGQDLSGSNLFIMNGENIKKSRIVQTPRIGIKVGVEHPWRFLIEGNSFVSKR